MTKIITLCFVLFSVANAGRLIVKDTEARILFGPGAEAMMIHRFGVLLFLVFSADRYFADANHMRVNTSLVINGGLHNNHKRTTTPGASLSAMFLKTGVGVTNATVNQTVPIDTVVDSIGTDIAWNAGTIRLFVCFNLCSATFQGVLQPGAYRLNACPSASFVNANDRLGVQWQKDGTYVGGVAVITNGSTQYYNPCAFALVVVQPGTTAIIQLLVSGNVGAATIHAPESSFEIQQLERFAPLS